MKPTVPLFLVLLLAGFSVAMPASAQQIAEVSNRVTDITVDEAPDQTVIRIVGDTHPTYSVYRLRNPLRLFVDISNSDLDGAPTSIDVDNGVISQIGSVSYEDELAQVTRVVIGFDADAMYDVVSDGTDLVITVDGSARRLFVDGSEPATHEEFAQLADELNATRAREAALARALDDAEARAAGAEADAIRDQLLREQAERERLEALQQAEAAVARVEDLDAARVEALDRVDALQHELGAREAELATMQSAYDTLEQNIAAREAAGEQTRELQALVAERDRQLQALETRRAELEALVARDEAPAAVTAPEPAAPAVATVAAIQDVRFEHVDGVDRVVIDVPGGAEFQAQPWADGRAALVFEAATLPDHLRRTLDTQAFAGPVSFVSSYTDADGAVQIVVEHGPVGSEIVRQDGDRVVWEFTGSAEVASSDLSNLPTAVDPVEPFAGTMTSYGESYGSVAFGDSPFQRRPRMTRKRLTIDLRNADILNVLRLIADEGNINIVAGDDVSGSITVRLRSVPLDEALAIILRSKGYGWEQTGNILRVAPIEDFEAEYASELQRMADAFGLEPLQVRLLPVNYAEADELEGLIGGVLSTRGTVATDGRTNTLIVTDIAAHLDTAESLVAALDTQTPQILIEARIVETNDQFRRQLGIQWGGDYVADQALGNSTGLLFPSTIGIAGGASDGQEPTNGTSPSPNFAVNLPAPAGTGEGGAIGFTFGNLAGSFNLNIRLSAAESEGSIKVVSAPRIMTLDNETASISSGVSIPVSVVSAAGAQTVFFDASLSLDVTPRVTPDGNIFLEVQISKNEPDFENTGARGDPSIIRREARTQLLVRDGDTTVIGGIFQRNTGSSVSRVPFFGSLPVIGPLFRNSSRTDARNELLVFITPRIVNRDVSIDALSNSGDLTLDEED